MAFVSAKKVHQALLIN